MRLRTRVKICGITQLEDALIAVHAGADALGFIFYQASPRVVSIEQAQSIMRKLPPFVNRIALFVDADKGFVQQVIDKTYVDTLQFHGAEDAHFCQQFLKPYYKVLRMSDTLDIGCNVAEHSHAQGFLCDTFDSQKMGGTGEVFDWSRMPSAENTQQVFMLAGGLTPYNVQDAILRTRPYAVDVSSGVELQAGIKSSEKIREFMLQVKLADQQLY